ncbi:MAG: glycerate 2-kinase [Desulfonauticus sp.]|nr:glycerate 2-kinase [Desulfonauticus sp.]
MLKKMKKDLEEIFWAGLTEVLPEKKIPKFLRLQENILFIGPDLQLDLEDYEYVVVLGAGKASASMALAVEKILQDYISTGLVIVKDNHSLDCQKVKIKEASHPLPDTRGLLATKELLEIAKGYRSEKTLILFLLSGGASSLLVLPASGLTLEDKQKTTDVLLASGADIKEINVLRKHLSEVKGGRLKKLLTPSVVVSLIISDVLGDDLESIGSAPLVGDSSTWEDCWHIVEKYGLEDKLPPRVIFRLRKGLRGEIEDTPLPSDPCFERNFNFILASNRQALLGAAQKARELGYNSLLLSSFIQGEAREVGRVLASVYKEILYHDNPVPKPACILSGGEPTVCLTPPIGKGGRNQELALSVGLEIAGLSNVLFASLGTDGTDGPTDACGAIVSGETRKLAEEKGLFLRKYLNLHDSYNLFKQLEALVITGPTYTNVMDMHIGLIK